MHYCWICLSLSDGTKEEHDATHRHKIRVTKTNNFTKAHPEWGGMILNYDLTDAYRVTDASPSSPKSKDGEG